MIIARLSNFRLNWGMIIQNHFSNPGCHEKPGETFAIFTPQQ
ncbi:hypothetical protein D1BOALGB6SA_9317 [Olavius sp. associated proteobacterium Delta 1]|nr:hypothetical protein D1BOALGB6SA_9317 [Olavius sp. associated proteobacterium Delta 1]